MAGVALEAGDVDQAERLLVEATDALRHAGPWFQTPNVNLLAIAAVRRGNADKAFALVRENLTHIRQLQDTFSLVYALVTLAAAAALKGDNAWAARILGAGSAVTERTVPQWSTNRCATSENRQSGRCAHASARIDGPARMPRGV
jgi:ATP/maltotriose-dependent transcriptional regulator MalT